MFTVPVKVISQISDFSPAALKAAMNRNIDSLNSGDRWIEPFQY